VPWTAKDYRDYQIDENNKTSLRLKLIEPCRLLNLWAVTAYSQVDVFFRFMFGFVVFAKNEQLGYETEIFFCLHIITLIM
jgi:hypothetical protein